MNLNLPQVKLNGFETVAGITGVILLSNTQLAPYITLFLGAALVYQVLNFNLAKVQY